MMNKLCFQSNSFCHPQNVVNSKQGHRLLLQQQCRSGISRTPANTLAGKEKRHKYFLSTQTHTDSYTLGGGGMECGIRWRMECNCPVPAHSRERHLFRPSEPWRSGYAPYSLDSIRGWVRFNAFIYSSGSSPDTCLSTQERQRANI